MTENTYDLRPKVKEIMTTINWLLDRIPEGVPLIVLMGEIHEISSHTALQQALLSELVRKGLKVSYGAELPHNLEPFTSKPIEIENLDDKSQVLKHFIHHGNTSAAPYTIKQLMKFCEEESISFSFNDLAQTVGKKYPFLDGKDPETRKFLKKSGVNPNKKTHFAKPLGIKLRNEFIALRAKSHIELTRPDIYVQGAGINHISPFDANFRRRAINFFSRLSSDGSQYTNEASLPEIFKSMGYAVLPVQVLVEGLDNKSFLGTQAAFTQSIEIQNLNSKTTYGNDSDEKEIELWNRMNSESGGVLKP